MAKRKIDDYFKKYQAKKTCESLVNPNESCSNSVLFDIQSFSQDAILTEDQLALDDQQYSDDDLLCSFQNDEIDSRPCNSPVHCDVDLNSITSSSSRIVPGPLDLSQNVIEGPKQPKLNKYPQTSFGSNKNKRMRSFSSNYYSEYPWLEYSIMKDAAFCFPCRFFSLKNNGEYEVFTVKGFNNWKKASEKCKGFSRHNSGEEHVKCQAKWDMYKNSKVDGENSVLAQINQAHLNLVQENREYIKILARVLLFTANQGIAQRAHDESQSSLNKGNFKELVDLLAEYDKFLANKLKSLPQNANYLSPTVQNKLIHIMSEMVLEKIGKEMSEAKYFTVM